MSIWTDINASLGITMPVFFLVLLGLFFRHIGVIREPFAQGLNRFVFQVALPVSIFNQLSQAEFFSIWDSKFLALCFLVTAGQILLSLFLSRAIKTKESRGESIQASYRSSTALLGVAYLQQAYGNASAGALMMLGCVPLYNIAAVILLEGKKMSDGEGYKKMLRDIVTNPIILSIPIGFCFSFFRIPMPVLVDRTVSSVAGLATPGGLLAMGAGINLRKLGKSARIIFSASVLKLVVYPALALPLAMGLGYTGDKLMAILIMTGSATTVAAYTMAKSLGSDGEISAGAVMLTTLLSAITLTLWILLLQRPLLHA